MRAIKPSSKCLINILSTHTSIILEIQRIQWIALRSNFKSLNQWAVKMLSCTSMSLFSCRSSIEKKTRFSLSISFTVPTPFVWSSPFFSGLDASHTYVVCTYGTDPKNLEETRQSLVLIEKLPSTTWINLELRNGGIIVNFFYFDSSHIFIWEETDSFLIFHWKSHLIRVYY